MEWQYAAGHGLHSLSDAEEEEQVEEDSSNGAHLLSSVSGAVWFVCSEVIVGC